MGGVFFVENRLRVAILFKLEQASLHAVAESVDIIERFEGFRNGGVSIVILAGEILRAGGSVKPARILNFKEIIKKIDSNRGI